MYKFDAAVNTEKCIGWIRNWFEENGKGCNAVVGISGGKDSSEKRKVLARLLGLPVNLSCSALIEAINLTVTRDEYEKATEKLKAPSACRGGLSCEGKAMLCCRKIIWPYAQAHSG